MIVGRKEFLTIFRYRIDFEGLTIGEFVDVSGLRDGGQTIKYSTIEDARKGMPVSQRPGIRESSTLIFRKGFFNNDSSYFLEWINSILEKRKFKGGNQYSYSPKNPKQRMSIGIIALRRNGFTGMKYMALNVFPHFVDLTGSGLSSITSGMWLEEVQFACEGIQIGN